MNGFISFSSSIGSNAGGSRWQSVSTFDDDINNHHHSCREEMMTESLC
jgi:hypothetical protein